MPRKTPRAAETAKPIEQYTHTDKQRVNNPPVGLVTPETDAEAGKRTYQYDPHLDPQLHWAGKAERTSFDVPTVSLHVHERIDSRTITEAVRRDEEESPQFSLFEISKQNPPIREAIEFYKHRHNWTNRLIAGDSLLVMNSLLEKEGMGAQVQMIYLDPPYGIRYGSNFQPFVNRRDVKDGRDEDLTSEPETIKAFRDTWELGIHSYLTYLRDRLLLARELLHESGSIFVQISDENVHLVRNLMDEVFGTGNFVSLIAVKRASVMFAKKYLNNACYFILCYAKDINRIKYRDLFEDRTPEVFAENSGSHLWLEKTDLSEVRKASPQERNDLGTFLNRNKDFRAIGTLSLNAQGTEKREGFNFRGQTYYPPSGTQWKTSYDGLNALAKKNRLIIEGNTVRYKQYLEDYPVMPINSLWVGIGAASDKLYVVQTSVEIIKRCILMTTDPGDLVFDPTCGSGTTAYVAEQWGRRWITCDTSRVATTLARGRLMTAAFDYYQLARPEEGIASGFRYKTVPHVTLKSIANNEPPAQETLYDQPLIDRSRTRITSPFTVEAVPAPVVASLAEIAAADAAPTADVADNSVTRSGETLRQQQWRDELLRSGIRTRGGARLGFARVEPLAATRFLHADAEIITEAGAAQRAVISFGQEYAPLEQRQVNRALEEANKLFPRPAFLIFAAFQFDPEAAKDIDETLFPGLTLLKAQMNADLLTDDLRKKRASNESFWLVGQPDVTLHEAGTTDANDKLYQVEVAGFDYYNTRTGAIESGGKEKIALWMLDTDYDGRSLFPRQVFFPLAGEKDGWARLAKSLKAQLDEDLIEVYRGTRSLPFTVGSHRRIAVKIVDDRGIESLKLIDVV